MALAAVAGTAMAQVSFEGYTSDPKEGEVSELKSISVTFPGVYDVDLNIDDVTLTLNGLNISGLTSKDRDDNVAVINLPETYTKAGEYVLTFKSESLYGYDKSYENSGPNKDAIVLKWNIAGEIDYFENFTVSPASGAITRLENMLITFPLFEEVEVSAGAAVSVTAAGMAVEGVACVQGDDKNVIKVTLPKEYTEAGEYVLTIPANALEGYHYTNDVAQDNGSPIVVKWTVVAPVKYEYTLKISSPRPNAAGEISAEKQLDAIYLVCDQLAGLRPDEDESLMNVTMREVNGDYLQNAHLTWAYGLNSNYSYFLFKCAQPLYNGKYEITIEKGAFGDAAWLENHEVGTSNDKIVLTFTLVDGKDREIYTIDATSLTPEAGEYQTGADIATFTITYPGGVEAVSEACATLGGVDVSDYIETVPFEKNADGSYSVTFPTPKEQGTYRFTVNAGAFGDAAFIAGEAGGKGSKAIELDYKVLTTTAVASIEADNAAEVIFNMQGLRVKGNSNELPAGLYIINGKKVLKTK